MIITAGGIDGTLDEHTGLGLLPVEWNAAGGDGVEEVGHIMVVIAAGSVWTMVENGDVEHDVRGDGRSAQCMLLGGQHCWARIGHAVNIADQGLAALNEDWN